jgi:20S proteasome alpha/beta subunit
MPRFRHVRQSLRQQHPRRGDDVQIFTQQLDLAVLRDQPTGVILRVNPSGSVDEAVGMIFGEESGTVFQFVDLDVRYRERREMRSEQLEGGAQPRLALEAARDADGREIGKVEDAVVGEQIDAPVDRCVQVSQSAKKGLEQFAGGGNGIPPIDGAGLRPGPIRRRRRPRSR